MEIRSAGTRPSTVHPMAIRAMAERGFDISGQRSKHLDEFRATLFDYVITVCDRAAETCPIFAGPAERLHWSVADPAAAPGSDEERLAAFRAARDELEGRLRTWWMATGTTPT
jgi:arsenate reductase